MQMELHMLMLAWSWSQPGTPFGYRLQKDIEHVGHSRPEAGAIALEKAMKARDKFGTWQIWWQSFVSNAPTRPTPTDYSGIKMVLLSCYLFL